MYPGTLVRFIENATSWRCSYIGEQWFFLPYILLMIASKWLFRVFSYMRTYLVLLINLIVYILTVFALKRYGEATLAGNMLFYNIFLAFYMLLPFSLGFLAKRERWMEKLSCLFSRLHIKQNWVVICLIILLGVGRCFISHQTVDPFYAIVFILLFSMVSVRPATGKALTFLGKHSMNIWLIHTWICIRLFHQFVYSLHYPVLMYIFVLVTSILVSIVVEYIYAFLNKTVISKLSISR